MTWCRNTRIPFARLRRDGVRARMSGDESRMKWPPDWSGSLFWSCHLSVLSPQPIGHRCSSPGRTSAPNCGHQYKDLTGHPLTLFPGLLFWCTTCFDHSYHQLPKQLTQCTPVSHKFLLISIPNLPAPAHWNLLAFSSHGKSTEWSIANRARHDQHTKSPLPITCNRKLRSTLPSLSLGQDC